MDKEKKEISTGRELTSRIWDENQEKNKIIKIVLLLFIVIVILAGILSLAYFFREKYRSLYAKNIQLESTLEETRSELLEQLELLEERLEKINEEAEEKAKEVGIIEGSLSYPSSYIPKDMTVCAENISNQEEICTSEQLYGNQYTYGVGYKLELPTGTYRVYSKTNNWEGYKAYYTELAKCGLVSGCGTHDPINVEVLANETVSKIDPYDWYKTN